jgi:hypothetical protein
MPTASEPPWWRSGVVYQVYPRSFADSDGDGIGDLEGVRRRLDHLAWLGVDAVWLSPFYRSPMADFGYDVSDFCAVDPLFGDLAAFDRLLAAAHDLGIRIVVDLVPNHSSDQHPWFQASRRAATTRSATGTCGATAMGRVRRRTTGSAPSSRAAGRGPGMPPRSSGTCTSSCPSSPT